MSISPQSLWSNSVRLLLLLPLVMSLVSNAWSDGARLGAYNVDISQTSVSGLSSGAAMAIQFDVAHSSIVKGAGIIAGAPYHCAEFDPTLYRPTTVCSCASRPCPAATIDLNPLIAYTDMQASIGGIDDTANLRSQRIFLFSGTLDQTVPTRVMDVVHSYFLHYANSPSNVSWKADLPAEHAMPTQDHGHHCSYFGTPYINKCTYDAAGKILEWIYGPDINPSTSGPIQGSLIRFDQSEFTNGPPVLSAMDTSGWVFVPKDCERGEPCKVHVAFHGCAQGQSLVGTAFVKHAGFNEWADTNHIVVLYPQVVTTNGGLLPYNPEDCWNWWGYDGDPDYATRSASQISAVKAMLDRLASGHR